MRVIPDDEICKPEDNIGAVVAHKLLFLDQLWEYYRAQLQESDFIKEISEHDISDSTIEKYPENGKIIQLDVGKVSESGKGSLEHSVYMETEYIKKEREESQKRQEKARELSNLLSITQEEALDIISERESDSNELKRPDVILKMRKKVTDKNIREVIVPEILTIASVETNGKELQDMPIFVGKYAWIPARFKSNVAMLAVYFNTFLKNSIGRKREDCNNDDYERAAEILNQQADYIKDFF